MLRTFQKETLNSPLIDLLAAQVPFRHSSTKHRHATLPPNLSSLTSRRSLLKTSAALAGGGPVRAGVLQAQEEDAKGPLMAYVGTSSSPLKNVRSTQVDLPPGNGRGIHLFQVDRAAGAIRRAKADLAAHPMNEEEKAEARRTFVDRYAHLPNPSIAETVFA